jgi:prolyl 4-hydroxylase
MTCASFIHSIAQKPSKMSRSIITIWYFPLCTLLYILKSCGRNIAQFGFCGSDTCFWTVSAFVVKNHQRIRFRDVTITKQAKRKDTILTVKSNKSSGTSSSAGFGQKRTASSSSGRNKETVNGHGFNGSIPNQQQRPFHQKDDDINHSTIRLDKWGLPPPTDEDIFPLMSKDTELIPIDPAMNYTISNIQQHLHDFFPNNINWNHMSLSTMPATAPLSVSISDQVRSESKEMKLRLVHVSPPVLMIEHFLTEQECFDVQHIVTDSNDSTNDDVVRVASKTISQYAISKRTSTSWFCSYKSIPTVLSKLQHILSIDDLSTCEEPQIVQYSIGQEFTWHYDEIPISQASNNGGQRIATILIYLNTIPQQNGGSTTFRDLTVGHHTKTLLSVQPIQGSVLIFFPSNRDGKPDDRTLHRSIPIVGNERGNKDISKWILQIWVHERSYTAVLPSNNRIDDAYSDIDAASRRLGYI